MPSSTSALQVVDHLLDDRRREALGRLVHDQQLGVREQRAADREHLLLAAGELGGADPLALGEPREELVDGGRRPAPRASAGSDHLQVLVRRQRLEQAPALRHVARCRSGDLV